MPDKVTKAKRSAAKLPKPRRQKPKSTRKRPRAAIDWSQVRAQFVYSPVEISLAQVAANNGIAYGTVRKRSAVEKWSIARDKAKREAGKSAADKGGEQALIATFREWDDKHLSAADRLHYHAMRLLKKRTLTDQDLARATRAVLASVDVERRVHGRADVLDLNQSTTVAPGKAVADEVREELKKLRTTDPAAVESLISSLAGYPDQDATA